MQQKIALMYFTSVSLSGAAGDKNLNQVHFLQKWLILFIGDLGKDLRYKNKHRALVLDSFNQP